METNDARRLLIDNPLDAQALCDLGLARAKEGRLPQAVELVSQAVASDSSKASIHCALGDLLRLSEKFLESACSYRQALQIEPEHAPALTGLGLLELDRREPDWSAAFLRRACALAPLDAALHCHLARALNWDQAFDEAEAEAKAALQLEPDNPSARCEMATSLAGRGRFREAIELLSAFLRRHPECGEARRRRVQSLNHLNFSEETAGVCRKDLALAPGDAGLHFELASHGLATGDWETGWREYEWRFRVPGQRLVPDDYPQSLGTPPWTGEDLAGKCLLVYGEQGLGDTLQFIRFLPELAQRHCKLVALVQPELKTLLRCFANIARIIPFRSGVPAHDFQIALLSVPRMLGTTLATLPCRVPYLSAPPDLPNGASMDDDGRLRVAFVWSTKPLCASDHRNVPLPLFETLFDLDSVAFYSVQVNERAEELEPCLKRPNVRSLHPFIRSMGDTASLLLNMDLVISIDTSVAHLAGALGLRVWLLLPCQTASWRWMRTAPDSPWNEKSPWYPSMRLFRATIFKDWTGVFSKVREELATLARTGGRRSKLEANSESPGRQAANGLKSKSRPGRGIGMAAR